MISKKINNISLRDMDKIRREMVDNRSIFQGDFRSIGISFLSRFSNVNLSEQKVEDITKSFYEVTKSDEVKNIDEFFKHICVFYLHIEKLPRNEFFIEYQSVNSIIKSLDNNINSYQNELSKLRSTSSGFDQDLRGQIKILNYYINKNSEKRSEAYEYLKDQIYEDAVNQSLGGIFKSLRSFQTMFGGYNFSSKFNPDHFEIKNISELVNKFSKLYLRDYYKVEKKDYKSKDFHDLVTLKYIEHHDVINKTKELCAFSHVLNDRKCIIYDALESYELKKYYSFCVTVSSIIEGLLEDYCLIMGVPEKKLKEATLSRKLMFIKEAKLFFYHFEYYYLKFSILRNKIAHGHKFWKDEPIEQIAGKLLLDLFDLCEEFISENIPLNKKMNLINQFISNNSDENAYEFIKREALGQEVIIPEFYNLKKYENKLMRRVNSIRFTKYLEKMVTAGKDVDSLKLILIKLKKENKKLYQEYSSLLKK